MVNYLKNSESFDEVAHINYLIKYTSHSSGESVDEELSMLGYRLGQQNPYTSKLNVFLQETLPIYRHFREVLLTSRCNHTLNIQYLSASMLSRNSSHIQDCFVGIIVPGSWQFNLNNTKNGIVSSEIYNIYITNLKTIKKCINF